MFQKGIYTNKSIISPFLDGLIYGGKMKIVHHNRKLNEKTRI